MRANTQINWKSLRSHKKGSESTTTTHKFQLTEAPNSLIKNNTTELSTPISNNINNTCELPSSKNQRSKNMHSYGGKSNSGTPRTGMTSFNITNPNSVYQYTQRSGGSQRNSGGGGGVRNGDSSIKNSTLTPTASNSTIGMMQNFNNGNATNGNNSTMQDSNTMCWTDKSNAINMSGGNGGGSNVGSSQMSGVSPRMRVNEANHRGSNHYSHPTNIYGDPPNSNNYSMVNSAAQRAVSAPVGGGGEFNNSSTFFNYGNSGIYSNTPSNNNFMNHQGDYDFEQIDTQSVINDNIITSNNKNSMNYLRDNDGEYFQDLRGDEVNVLDLVYYWDKIGCEPQTGSLGLWGKFIKKAEEKKYFSRAYDKAFFLLRAVAIPAYFIIGLVFGLSVLLTGDKEIGNNLVGASSLGLMVLGPIFYLLGRTKRGKYRKHVLVLVTILLCFSMLLLMVTSPMSIKYLRTIKKGESIPVKPSDSDIIVDTGLTDPDATWYDREDTTYIPASNNLGEYPDLIDDTTMRGDINSNTNVGGDNNSTLRSNNEPDYIGGNVFHPYSEPYAPENIQSDSLPWGGSNSGVRPVGNNRFLSDSSISSTIDIYTDNNNNKNGIATINENSQPINDDILTKSSSLKISPAQDAKLYNSDTEGSENDENFTLDEEAVTRSLSAYPWMFLVYFMLGLIFLRSVPLFAVTFLVFTTVSMFVINLIVLRNESGWWMEIIGVGLTTLLYILDLSIDGFFVRALFCEQYGAAKLAEEMESSYTHSSDMATDIAGKKHKLKMQCDALSKEVRMCQSTIQRMQADMRTPLEGIMNLIMFVEKKLKLESVSNLNSTERQDAFYEEACDSLMKTMSTSTLRDLSEYTRLLQVAANQLQALTHFAAEVNRNGGHMGLVLAPCELDLSSTLRDGVRICHASAAAKGINMHSNGFHRIPQSAFADPVRIIQALNSVMSTSVESTEKGDISVAFATQENNENTTTNGSHGLMPWVSSLPWKSYKHITVKIIIKDTGKGIEPQKLQSIMGATNCELSDGYDYSGLTSGRTICIAMGGDCFVDSDGIGKGTTYKLTFSCLTPSDFVANDNLNSPRSSSVTPSNRTGGSSRTPSNRDGHTPRTSANGNSYGYSGRSPRRSNSMNGSGVSPRESGRSYNQSGHSYQSQQLQSQYSNPQSMNPHQLQYQQQHGQQPPPKPNSNYDPQYNSQLQQHSHTPSHPSSSSTAPSGMYYTRDVQLNNPYSNPKLSAVGQHTQAFPGNSSGRSEFKAEDNSSLCSMGKDASATLTPRSSTPLYSAGSSTHMPTILPADENDISQINNLNHTDKLSYYTACDSVKCDSDNIYLNSNGAINIQLPSQAIPNPRSNTSSRRSPASSNQMKNSGGKTPPTVTRLTPTAAGTIENGTKKFSTNGDTENKSIYHSNPSTMSNRSCEKNSKNTTINFVSNRTKATLSSSSTSLEALLCAYASSSTLLKNKAKTIPNIENLALYFTTTINFIISEVDSRSANVCKTYIKNILDLSSMAVSQPQKMEESADIEHRVHIVDSESALIDTLYSGKTCINPPKPEHLSSLYNTQHQNYINLSKLRRPVFVFFNHGTRTVNGHSCSKMIIDSNVDGQFPFRPFCYRVLSTNDEKYDLSEYYRDYPIYHSTIQQPSTELSLDECLKHHFILWINSIEENRAKNTTPSSRNKFSGGSSTTNGHTGRSTSANTTPTSKRNSQVQGDTNNTNSKKSNNGTTPKSKSRSSERSCASNESGKVNNKSKNVSPRNSQHHPSNPQRETTPSSRNKVHPSQFDTAYFLKQEMHNGI